MKINVKIITVIILFVCAFIALNCFNTYKINSIRQSCVSKVETMVNFDDYRTEEQKQINKYIELATEKIEKMNNEDEINKVADYYIEKIDKLSTKKEIRQAELEKERQRQEQEKEVIARGNADDSVNNHDSGSRGCVRDGAENFY